MLKLTLTFVKATKNTYYFEDSTNGAKGGNFYLPKTLFTEQPTNLIVSIETFKS